MTASGERSKPNYAAIAAGVLALILYGSFYPFEYLEGTNPSGPLRALLATWHDGSSPVHFAANVLLYVPLGLFAALALTRHSTAARILRVCGLGLVLSFGIELAQYYARGRDSELADVYGNVLGTFLGALAGAVLARYADRSGNASRPRVFVAILLGCWLASQLFAARPAHRAVDWSTVTAWVDVYRYAATWLAIALLCEGLAGKDRARSVPLLLFAVVFLGRAAVAGQVLSRVAMGGGALGLLIWITVLSRWRFRAVLVAAMFAVAVALQALEPFTFQVRGRAFGMIPFRSFIEAPEETAVPAYFEKVFMYGSLVWLIARTGLTTSLAAIYGGALVLAVRWLQIYLPGRSAEITDFIMLLLLAVMLHLMREGPQGLATMQDIKTVPS